MQIIKAHTVPGTSLKMFAASPEEAAAKFERLKQQSADASLNAAAATGWDPKMTAEQFEAAHKARKGKTAAPAQAAAPVTPKAAHTAPVAAAPTITAEVLAAAIVKAQAIAAAEKPLTGLAKVTAAFKKQREEREAKAPAKATAKPDLTGLSGLAKVEAIFRAQNVSK